MTDGTVGRRETDTALGKRVNVEQSNSRHATMHSTAPPASTSTGHPTYIERTPDRHNTPRTQRPYLDARRDKPSLHDFVSSQYISERVDKKSRWCSVIPKLSRKSRKSDVAFARENGKTRNRVCVPTDFGTSEQATSSDLTTKTTVV
jgi:hypothetical protein